MLGLEDAADTIAPKPKKKVKRTKKVKTEPALPTRRSARTKGIKPEFVLNELYLNQNISVWHQLHSLMSQNVAVIADTLAKRLIDLAFSSTVSSIGPIKGSNSAPRGPRLILRNLLQSVHK